MFPCFFTNLTFSIKFFFLFVVRAPKGMDRSWEDRRVEGLEMIGFVEANKAYKSGHDTKNMKSINSNNGHNNAKYNYSNQWSLSNTNNINNTQLKSKNSCGSMKLWSVANGVKFNGDDVSLNLPHKHLVKGHCCSNHSADAKIINHTCNTSNGVSIINRLMMSKRGKEDKNNNRKCHSDVNINKIIKDNNNHNNNKHTNNKINAMDLNLQCQTTSYSSNPKSRVGSRTFFNFFTCSFQ